jgi:hypothetical protein
MSNHSVKLAPCLYRDGYLTPRDESFEQVLRSTGAIITPAKGICDLSGNHLAGNIAV